MKFQNKLPKTNHNVSSESDSSLFFRYVWFFLFIAWSIYILFFMFSFFVIQFISIEDEAQFIWEKNLVFNTDDNLTKRIRKIYPDFPYKLWVTDMWEEENAFASLWWNIYVTKSLLENAQSKNEIDFILGHEIAHIENRDVLRRIISSLPTYLFLSLLWNNSWITVFDMIVGNPHSKTQESNADEIGLEYIMKTHWHVGCILRFFEKNNSLSDNVITFFSGHPMTDTRIKKIQDLIKQKWYPDGECIDLNY